MALRAIIRFEHDDIHQPAPWSVGLDSDNRVASGLGPDDGAYLIGFGPQEEQAVTVLAKEALENPELAVGLIPTFGNGSMFSWNLVVRELEVL